MRQGAPKMNRRPTAQQVTRLFVHDALCMSEGCEGDRARRHADRTQRPVGRSVSEWFTNPARDFDGLRAILHDHLCLGCTNPAAHTDRLRPSADRLLDRIVEAGCHG